MKAKDTKGKVKKAEVIETPVVAKSVAELLRDAEEGKATVTLFVTEADSLEYEEELMAAGLQIEKTVEFELCNVLVFTQEELTALTGKAGLFAYEFTPSYTQNVTWFSIGKPITLPARVKDYVKTPRIEALAAVSIQGRFNGSEEATFALIASMLHPAVKRPIELSVPHGHNAQYRSDGPFQIYIWSAPDHGIFGRRGEAPREIWGIKTLCTDEPFYLREQCLNEVSFGKKKHKAIVLCDGEYAVATLLPNALYVHHDLVHRGGDEEFELFAELLSRCILLIVDPDARANYQEKLEALRLEREKARAEEERKKEELRIEREKNAFANLVERSVQKRAQRNHGALEKAERVAARKKAEYFEAERLVFAERQALLDPEAVKARFLAEYEKLRLGNVNLVTGVTYNPSRPEWITIHTGQITAEHPRTKDMHLIGRCNAAFNLETGDITIVNKDKAFSDGMRTVHTPHVFEEDGTNVCLGNIKREIQSYIAHYEIEAAAILTVAFLQSVTNEISYISRLEHFPIVRRAQVAA